jgi:hypothetical protein
MSAAARPHPDEPEHDPAVAPPRLAPVAPAARRTPRRPPPEVVRRRRITALALFAVVIAGAVALVAGLGGGGGGASGDAGAISKILEAGTASPATLCDHMSPAMSAAIGGRAACVKASPEKGPEGKVTAVKVSGDATRATATIVTGGGDERVTLVKRGGSWLVDDVR